MQHGWCFRPLFWYFLGKVRGKRCANHCHSNKKGKKSEDITSPPLVRVQVVIQTVNMLISIFFLCPMLPFFNWKIHFAFLHFLFMNLFDYTVLVIFVTRKSKEAKLFLKYSQALLRLKFVLVPYTCAVSWSAGQLSSTLIGLILVWPKYLRLDKTLMQTVASQLSLTFILIWPGL